jgi:hypothetical protein
VFQLEVIHDSFVAAVKGLITNTQSPKRGATLYLFTPRSRQKETDSKAT